MVIQHNMSAMNASRLSKYANNFAAKRMERLSSGYRINRASDDAAGLSISEKMRGQIRGLDRSVQNIQEGINLCQIADGGLNEIHAVLQRMRELSVQSANGTYLDSDRELIDPEVQSLKEEVDKIAVSTHYNGIPPLSPYERVEQVSDGNPSSGPSSNNMEIFFAIDVSGSMSSSLEFVQETITNFMADVPSGAQVGFIIYSDQLTESGESMKIFDLDSNVDKVFDFINNIDMMYGGDTPEAGLEAVHEAIDRLSATASNNQHIVLITDATSHTADTLPGKATHTVEETNQRLIEEGVTMNVFIPGGSPKAIEQGKGLSEGTGGKVEEDFQYNYDDFLNDVMSSLPEPVKISDDIWIQGGANEGIGMNMKRHDSRAMTLGITDVSLATQKSSSDAIPVLDAAIKLISSFRGDFGAYQNRLESMASANRNTHENLSSAESRIRDADMAEEVISMTKYNLLTQASQAILAQANQLPEMVTALL